MTTKGRQTTAIACAMAMLSGAAWADGHAVGDDVIAAQRAALA